MITGEKISFAFIGDTMVGGDFIAFAKKHNIELLHPFRAIKPNLFNTDLCFVNLEGPIFEGSDKRSDVTTLLSNHPKILDLFNVDHLCVFNLANNHIMDYGVEGLNHTIALLKKNNLNYLGAGNNDREANQALIVECKGKRIAFVAYTSDEKHVGSIIAGPQRPGCASFLDVTKATRRVAELKQKTDIVCVSLHWGHEYLQYPSPKQIEIAHAFVDAGANFVIGHHPHVIQGIEKYKDALIIYSLGNFFFPPVRSTSGRPQYQKEITKEFMIITSGMDAAMNIEFSCLGGTVNDGFAMTPFDDQTPFLTKISRLSEQLCCQNYKEFWGNYKDRREKQLIRESLSEAFNKLRLMTFKDLISTVKLSDIKRNLERFYSLLTK